MAQELIRGTLFTQLDNGVNQAILYSKSTKFQHILEDLKFTINSLKQLCNEESCSIGERDLELNLPEEEIENLRKQVEEGVKMVAVRPKFHKRDLNLGCAVIIDHDDIHHQIVELDTSLERLLEKLKDQKAMDVKKFLFRAGITKEYFLLDDDGDGVMNKDRGAALAKAFGIMFDGLKEVKDANTRKLKHLFGNLKSTMDSLKPFVEEMERNNKILDRPLEEVKSFTQQLEEGAELVRKCSKLRLWNGHKESRYNKLDALDASLRRQLNVMREQVAMFEEEGEMRNLHVMLLDSTQRRLPEPPSSPTVVWDADKGTGDVKEEALVSASNIKAAGFKLIEYQIEEINLNWFLRPPISSEYVAF